MNPGCRSMLTVRNTGDSVVPWEFEQPAVNASAARAVNPNRNAFLMRPSPLRPEDPGRDEDQEFVVLLGPGLVLEQVPEDGDHVVLVLVVDLEDAADDRRAAVLDEDLAAVLADRQRHVLTEGEVQGDGRLALHDVDHQQ